MRQEYKKGENYHFIDNIAKELYGYDDATLQKEMDEAEAACEQQKKADPEAESQILEAMQSNFMMMMGRIEEQALEPVSLNAYVKRQQEDQRKVANEWSGDGRAVFSFDGDGGGWAGI